MINKRFITQWFTQAPWSNTAQVEQDLIISRALVDIFNNKILRDSLVFRGGTALNKLFLKSSLRYSEDLDFVQYKAGSIGDLMTALHQTLDPWLGKPKYKQTQGRITFYYRFETENSPVKSMKLKIEINTREHGSELDLINIPFQVENGWYSQKTVVRTYVLEELISTKLRALYQRRKGRDLFDLYYVLTYYPDLDIRQVIKCFRVYLKKENLTVSRAEFEENMYAKLQNDLFKNDIFSLLPANLIYDQHKAYQEVHSKVISQIQGEPWKLC